MTQTSITSQTAHAKREDFGRIVGGPELLTLPTVDGTVKGPATYAFAAGATLVAGQSVILDSSSTWQLTDANTAGIRNGLKGIVVYGGSAADYILVALPGSIVYLTDFATLTIGAPYYISETAGAITATVPTTGTSGQIEAGVAVHADMLFVTMRPYAIVSGA